VVVAGVSLEVSFWFYIYLLGIRKELLRKFGSWKFGSFYCSFIFPGIEVLV
jgi:hypothetical protein